MGVPGFVAWLRKYFKDIMIIPEIPNQVKPKTIYIDGNCLVHPKCFEVLDFYKNPVNGEYPSDEKLELCMFKRIVNYIDYLVAHSGATECYFAIDGVAPIAKINQQRKRRYRTIDDTQMRNNLKKTHGLPIDQNTWSNTVITPGTQWMERLHQFLHAHFSGKSHNPANKVNYIYSSYHTPGEGEHKILTHIKSRPDYSREHIYVIYGLDADLFFLAMASNKPNLFLLREEHHFVNGKPAKMERLDPVNDVCEELRYVNIDTTIKCCNELIRQKISEKAENYEQIEIPEFFWDDFIFICYLLGNDFLPHLPSIDIHSNGLDIVIDYYAEIILELGYKLLDSSAIPEIKINTGFLLELLRLLADEESIYFCDIVPKNTHRKAHRKCPSSEPYAQELWAIENMRINIDDPIKLGHGNSNDWKARYYTHYMKVASGSDIIKSMCKIYLEGLVWVTRYYFNTCPGWEWQYPYTHAPFISDIYNYLAKSDLDLNSINFDKAQPFSPCVQLLSVLPPACSHLIPKKYQELISNPDSPIIDLFPSSVELDMINKDMYWMAVPMLPILDVSRIKKAVGNIKLSPSDLILNQNIPDFFY